VGQVAGKELTEGYARLRARLARPVVEPVGPVETIYRHLTGSDPEWAEARLQDTIDYYARLDRETFKDFLEVFGPSEYMDYHRYRFSECFAIVTDLIDETFGDAEPFTFVEVSTAGGYFVEQMRKRYGDRLSYVAVDFPQERGGTGWGESGRPGEILVEVDLNQLADFEPPEPLVELVTGRNVVVLASEIIEHLLIDIGDLVRFWRDLVDGGRGHMVVTTPSFHAEWRLGAMLRGLNPIERYTDRSRVRSGFVHVREYAAREMLEIEPPVPGATCAFTFAMPGPLSPQISQDEYFALADRFARTGDDAEQRGPLAMQMLNWEGMVATYPFGPPPAGADVVDSGSIG
jgi:hypothetical protein